MHLGGSLSPAPIVGALVLIALAPLGVRGQDGCELGDRGNDVVNIQTLPGIGQVTYITRPHFVCEGGVQIFADSAIAYGEQGMSHLIGSVRYLESARELRADEARYFTNEGRLQAEGRMSLRDDEQGSSIQNGDLVYLLETDFRDESTMTVTIGADGLRPRAILTPAEPEAIPQDTTAATDSSVVVDSVGPPGAEEAVQPVAPEAPADTLPPTPYTVDSDRMFIEGQGSFTASGDVEIVRDSLFAFGDSAVYDQTGGGLLLEGSARVEGEAYRLIGRTISMGAPGATVSEVRARREASLVGDGFELTAAQIVLFLRDDALERLVAIPIMRRGSREELLDSADLERPEAFVQDFLLTADSLEINAPGEAIERVFAAGTARSNSTSRDSLNIDLLPDVARSDWLEGDTVIVTFQPTPGATSASDVDVEAITAVGGARSLYRLPPNDSTAVPGTDAPALHYVIGDSIRITMLDGAVLGMRITGQTQGMHFEPLARSAPPDTASAVSDSLSLPVDTSEAVVDTAGVAQQMDPASGRTEPEPTRRSRDPAGPRSEETPWIRP